jgi:hypothetical protein
MTPGLQLARAPQGPAPAPAPTAAPAPVQNRIEAPAVTTSALVPTVQMSAAAAPSVPVFTATPVVQRVEGTAPQGDTGTPARTDKELDELAKQLFGRLRGQIRAEVITEREARGLGFDAF